MSDTTGHDPSQRDERYSMTLTDLEAAVAAAGVLISRRQLMRHCESGTFEAKKFPATNNLKEWFIVPASVDKGIADIKVLQELRARRDGSRHDASGRDVIENANNPPFDTAGHDAPKPDTSASVQQETRERTGTDMSGHDTTQRVVSDSPNTQSKKELPPEPLRRTMSEIDIYEHPYVRRLEDRVEKLEAKYEAQVRRTEEIQMLSQEKLLELQRMITIGQYKTLADYMLQAKNFILGQSTTESAEAPPTSAP